MLRYLVILILGLLVGTLFFPAQVFADHSPVCGTLEIHNELELTKGRTDGVIYHVDHMFGCKRVILSNLSPAGVGEAQGNPGQMDRCVRYGKEDAVNAFRFYWHEALDLTEISVRCTNWTGGD